MFTGFEKKFAKVKAKILNETTPVFTETELRQRNEFEKKKKVTITSQLKKELSKELSREKGYVEGVLPNSKEHEAILSRNDLEKKVSVLGGAVGGSVLTKIKDDGFGVFKPYDDFELMERKLQIQNERAAYLVDLFLGFDLVPPTVIREFADLDDNSEHVGSMQQFIEQAAVGAELKNKGKDDIDLGEISKLAIFDFMIKNTDRHSSNYLIKDKKLFAIDHGLCFASKVSGFRDDEKDTPEAILSGEYYDLQHRSNFFNEETFWNLQLPQENLNKLRDFNNSTKDKLIFGQLFQELLGERKSTLFMDRITSIISSLEDDGKLNKETLKKSIGEKLANYQKDHLVAEAA